MTGETESTDFPATPGSFQSSSGGGTKDAFVAKLNADGSALVYATYLGGENDDVSTDIAVDTAGQAYVIGDTDSPNFPTTPESLQPTHNDNVDVFVTKLTPDGSALVYSTYLGGSGDDIGTAIAVVAGGDVYVTGPTSSRDFPKTAPLQFEFAGSESAFVAKIGDSVEVLADLTLGMAASPDPVVTGHDVTFTMIVTNDGPEVASEVTLITTLPEPSYQVSFVSATTSQGSCARAEHLVICSLGSLLVDTSAIVEVVLRLVELSPFPYSASIFSDIADPDVTNNICIPIAS